VFPPSPTTVCLSERLQAAAVLCCAGALLALPWPAHAKLAPKVIQTQYSTKDVVIAATTVAPFPEKHRDATKAIQAAIDEAAEAGGAVVFLEAGVFHLHSPLLIREGVTLRGDWLSPRIDARVQGTVLAVNHGKDLLEGPPAITMERGTGIREVAIWYPDQDVGAPAAYPWSIRFSPKRGGDNMTVLNVTMVNPYQAIKVGPESNELHTIQNVFATPLLTGLSFDSTTDIGRVTNVTITPRIWEASGLSGAPAAPESSAALRGWLKSKATATDIGRSDWEYLYSLDVEGYAVGLEFRQGKRGTTNAVMLNCRLTDCKTALLLSKLNATGLAATGCTFAGEQASIRAPETFRGAVAQFNTCTFAGTPATAVSLEGNGLLTLQNCQFSSASEGTVTASAGDISLINCDFPQARMHISLGPDVRRARILSCRFEGGPKLVNSATACDSQISHHQLDVPLPDISPHHPARIPTPSTSKLFSVTDCGASSDVPDNTAAFQQALDQAGEAGGTVYVPAGLYRFKGEITVPTGVELRGIFDVPHHTMSGGSVLLPIAGRGAPDGTPFIQLQPNSGLRGLTVWYPEQDLKTFAPYPWTVRAMGPRCWVVDTTLGNAYQGIDFWTHPSTGHVIRYLAGCFLKTGLWISKSDGPGWVEDVQLNPHYGNRLHPSLPRVDGFSGRDIGWRTVDFQRKNLEGIVFGRCQQEHVRGTFLYAAYDGIAFRDDQGGTNGRILMHGTDTGSRAAVLEHVGPKGVSFLCAQLVPLGKYVVAGIVSTPSFTGNASFFNSQLWAGPCSGILNGPGTVVLQQLTTRSGEFKANRGTLDMMNANIVPPLAAHVTIGPECASARIIGNVSANGVFRIMSASGDRLKAAGNACSYPVTERSGQLLEAMAIPMKPNRPSWSVPRSFEQDEGPLPEIAIAKTGGGIRNMPESSCQVVDTDKAASGTRALELRGRPATDHAFVYYRISAAPIPILPDTELSYSIMPLNKQGRHTAIDAVFAAGLPLRDRGFRTTTGGSCHPSPPRGKVGEWTRITIPLGRHAAGEEIRHLMCAYDSRKPGPFSALFDDIEIRSGFAAGMPWKLELSPRGGRTSSGTQVTISGQRNATVHYTLDGMLPTAESPVAKGSIPLRGTGLVELRVRPRVGTRMGAAVHGALFTLTAAPDTTEN
jgi:hypothetical protein